MRRDDVERGYSFEAFEEVHIRAEFLRKVLFIVLMQMLFTLGVTAMFVFIEEVQLFALENIWLLYVAMGVTFVVMIALACVESLRRQTPQNYCCLCIFTLAESFMVGVISSVYAPRQVFLALCITIAIVLALTLFATQTAIDFTVCTGIALVLVILLMIFGIVLFFVHIKVLHLIYCCGGVLIFSLILIIDIQMMMGGQHKYSIDPEDYVFAALNIYIDIILIFLYILQLVGILDS